jgi:hypothetical protein
MTSHFSVLSPHLHHPPHLPTPTTPPTASGDRYTVLLSAAIVEELELSSNFSTIAADNSTVNGYQMLYLQLFCAPEDG